MTRSILNRSFLVRSLVVAVVLTLAGLARAAEPQGAVLRRSGDAYVRQAGTRWFIGTDKVTKEVRYENGHLALVSFQDATSHREYIEGSPSEVFRFELDGQSVTSQSESWSLEGATTEILSQGELLLSLRVRDRNLRVTKNYVIYPEESIIQEWATLANISPQALTIGDPYFLQMHILQNQVPQLEFSYMTGGMCFWGSWIRKTLPLTPTYARTFDASDAPECLTPDKSCPKGWAAGNSIYSPIYTFFDTKAKNGVFIGWDYMGRWGSQIGNYEGGPVNVSLKVSAYRKSLAPRERLETPKAFTGIYSGDWDEMGNQLLDYQYRFKWDYTRDKYFPAIQILGYWWNGAGDLDPHRRGMDVDATSTFLKVFRTADTMRYVGADRFWRDYGWWDRTGDWNGPDFNSTRRYLDKYGMTQTLYTIVYNAEAGSKVVTDHPDWLIERGGRFGGRYVLDQSNPGVINFERGILEREVADWGDFEWRKDSTPMQAVNHDYTPMLGQDQGFRTLVKSFLDRNPGNSFHGCAGGGNDLGYELLRMADAWQYSDGCVGRFRTYYASYLYPPDKLVNMPDNWDPNKYEKSVWRGLLWNSFPMTGDTMDPAKLEGLRQLIDIYHYLAKEGVVGRWVKIYHPAVTGDTPDWYLERLSRDNQRGILIPGHNPNASITIFPKGLVPEAKYNVSYQESSASEERLGADLMRKGITLGKMADGELVYLNLPMHPGSAADKEPPSAPTQVVKRVETNMGVVGVELSWTPATDNNWISYYEIFRDGAGMDKVSKGEYYFDHSAGADPAAQYAVRTVDGSGNTSAKTAAQGYSGSVSTVVDDADDTLKYSGSGWKHASNVVAVFKGTESSSETAGDAVEFKFRGNRFTWYTRLASSGGKADVQFDGGSSEIVDGYDADDIPNFPVYARTFPMMGEHTVKITIRKDRNERSTGQTVIIDGFQIGNAENLVVEDAPGQGIEYAGAGWKHDAHSWEQASGRSLSWSDHPDDVAAHNFRGDSIAWIGKRCSACGEADIYIDGVLDTTVDTYAPGDEHPYRLELQAGWQTPLYERTWAQAGQHSIRVVVKHRKNMRSEGHRIYLDSLQVGNSAPH